MNHSKLMLIAAEDNKRFIYALNDKGLNKIDFLIQGSPDTSYRELDVIAEFIVRACNNHYQLLEACKALTKAVNTRQKVGAWAKVMPEYASAIYAIKQEEGDQ